MVLKEKAIGAFIIGTTAEVHHFSKKEIDLSNILSFQASLAVANARLYQKAQQAIIDLTQTYDATLEGWEIMKTHPELAYQILSNILYLALAMDIPYCHHERWDGTGYPRKLKGTEIPLSARIFAVVDMYDALTSDRPYRIAWTKEEALTYIKSQSGKHFDPEAVKAFLELLEE